MIVFSLYVKQAYKTNVWKNVEKKLYTAEYTVTITIH